MAGGSSFTFSTNSFGPVYTGAGSYVLLLCDAGKQCNGGITTNSAVFTIISSNTTTTQPSITVSSPTAGQSFSPGQQIVIRYSANNFPKSVNVAMQLNKGAKYPNGPFYPVDTQSTSIGLPTYGPATGSYTWTIPFGLTPGNDYSILISSDYPNTETSAANEGYSGNFTITSASTSTPVLPTPTPVPPTPTPVAPTVSNSVSATVVSASDNKAGATGVFGPGKGYGYYAGGIQGQSNDWTWNMSLTLGSSETISYIEVSNTGSNQVWSTRNTGGFPLVVYANGRQLNTAYGQTLGAYPAGTINLTLYGQIDNINTPGTTIAVGFPDGTSVTGSIPTTTIKPVMSSTASSASALNASDAAGWDAVRQVCTVMHWSECLGF